MRVLNLAAKDLIQILRDWKSALFLVLMPIIFTLFFGFIFGSGGDGSDLLPVGYPADAEVDPAKAKVVELAAASGAIDLQPISGTDLSVLERGVQDGSLAGAFSFAPGFPEAVESGTPSITLIADVSSPAGQTVLEAIETAFDRYLSAQQIADLSVQYYGETYLGGENPPESYRQEALDLALGAWSTPPVRVRSQMGGTSSQSEVEMGFTQSSPGMIVQFAIFGLITSAMVLVMERKSGAMKRLLTTPMRRFELIGGHVLAMFFVVFLQQLILVLLGHFAFEVEYLRSPLAILIMCLALAFWASSLGLAIGAISKTEEQVVTISLVAMFLFAGLGGAWFPLEFTGETFSAIGHLMPTAWAMDGFQNVIVRGLGLQSVLLPAGLLSAYGLAFFGLAVWRFQVE